MDGFMDKIAQKLGAQEAIRANAAADAAQIERLEAQVKEYDACIKEMRKLNLRNAENEQKLKEMLENVSKQVKCALEQSSEQIGQLVERSGGQIGQLIEQSSGQIGQLVEKSSGQIGQLMEQSSEQIGQLVEKSSGQIEQITEECIAKLRGAEEEEANKAGKGEEVEKLLEEVRTLTAENMTKMEEMFRRADDFVHRENVKVYRNVQAATTEELEKQTQAVISGQQELERKNKKLYTIGILTLITSIANLGLLIAYLAGLF